MFEDIPIGERVELDIVQEVCPRCLSDNITNEGAAAPEGFMEVTCHHCMLQWIEPGSDEPDESSSSPP